MGTDNEVPGENKWRCPRGTWRYRCGLGGALGLGETLEPLEGFNASGIDEAIQGANQGGCAEARGARTRPGRVAALCLLDP